MELTIIIILLLYIVFLQYQLHKKSLYTEGLVQKMMDFERKLDPEGITKLMRDKGQQENSQSVSNLLEESVQNFLLEDEAKCKIFVHYTRDEEIAQNIFSEGFFFVDSFHKTAEAITNDQINLVYKHYLHKNYGKYIIVISISKDIFNYYTNEIGKSKRVINVEQLLSEAEPCVNENDDEVYLLPKQFIKGYINLESGKTIRNPNYNPYYDSPTFAANIKRLVS
jgi:hypothetical protein